MFPSEFVRSAYFSYIAAARTGSRVVSVSLVSTSVACVSGCRSVYVIVS